MYVSFSHGLFLMEESNPFFTQCLIKTVLLGHLGVTWWQIPLPFCHLDSLDAPLNQHGMPLFAREFVTELFKLFTMNQDSIQIQVTSTTPEICTGNILSFS